MTIDRPVEKVLEFVEDPRNLAGCSARVDRVIEAGPSARRVGRSFRLVYRLFGIRFSEEFTVARFSPPPRQTPHRRFQIWQTFRGAATGDFTWTLEAEVNQTYASVDIAYQLAGGVFGNALDALFVERAVRKDVDDMLAAMKRQLAGQATPVYAVTRN